MKYTIPDGAVCCVCGQQNPTDYIQIAENAVAFVHIGCYKAECNSTGCRIKMRVREAAKLDKR